MAIRQRGGSFQVDVTINGTRYREDVSTEEAAIKREAEIKLALKRGHDPAQGKPKDIATTITMEELQKRCFDRIWKDTKAAAIVEKTSLQIVRYFGPKTAPHTIDATKVDEFVADCEAHGNSNGTVNRKLACLSKMLKFAKERGWVREVPKMPRKPEGEGRIRFLTDEEENKALATLRVWGFNDLHDLFILLLDTGCRLGEALKVEWVDFSDRAVTFWVNKADKPRTIPMTARVREMVAKRKGQGKGPFTDLTKHSIRHHWNRLRTYMGMDDDPAFVPHMLRHSCASRLVQAGVDIRRVQEWMGHKTIQITLRYAHLAPHDLFRVVEVLERKQHSATNQPLSSHLRVV